MSIPLHICKFVLASDLFKGFAPTIYEEMVEGEPDFSWGDNNRSMVTIKRLLEHMDSCNIEYPPEFIDRCNSVGLNTYVDLEN